jgi:NAD+ synthase (glutamine-hydrolysing)
MNHQIRIALAQMNPVVGDVEGNAQAVLDYATRARDDYGASMVLFPELCLAGYPPEDLLLRESLLEWVDREFTRLLEQIQGITVVLGLPLREAEGLYNAAIVFRDGEILARYHKHVLPNYSVFDEKRYFLPGSEPAVFDHEGIRVGVTVCEDIWHPEPSARAAEAGAKLLLNINASPFHQEKYDERIKVLQDRVTETGCPVVYLNMVGNQDELVFDGESLVMSSHQDLLFRAPAFEEGLYGVDIPVGHPELSQHVSLSPRLENDALVYKALVMGVRDYIEKNGFKGSVIGLSGGIDSALTLAIAVDALGADQVEAVMMPSRYTSDMSQDDAAIQAKQMGVNYRVLPIEGPFLSFLELLEDEFRGLPADATEENIQARCRGIILMAISNKSGRMLLTTGNKSEMAVGYATLYGDMAGGFAPLKDVVKTQVYRLARYRNSIHPVIPERVLTRAPSAELAPDQKDEDSLPPYEVLDPILQRFIEDDRSVASIIAEGYDAETVRRVASMVLNNEYKRRQAPPGVRITRRAFGKDRRYPITSGYRRLFA